jgi:hypothetical protein
MWGNTGTRYRDDRRDDYQSNDSRQFVTRSQDNNVRLSPPPAAYLDLPPRVRFNRVV